MDERPPVWMVAATILSKQLRTAARGGPAAWGLGEVLTTPHRKTYHVTKYSHGTRNGYTEL